MDETYWKHVQKTGKTIAPVEVRSSKVEIEGNEKSVVAVTASVTMSGRKPPLVDVRRGKTGAMCSHLDEIAPNNTERALLDRLAPLKVPIANSELTTARLTLCRDGHPSIRVHDSWYDPCTLHADDRRIKDGRMRGK
jgi:hypothetical protein